MNELLRYTKKKEAKAKLIEGIHHCLKNHLMLRENLQYELFACFALGMSEDEVKEIVKEAVGSFK